jgi:hypothetical protein
MAKVNYSDYSEDARRLKALFKSGQDKYASFFSALADVRKRMRDDMAFARWCFYELHLPARITALEAEITATKEAVAPQPGRTGLKPKRDRRDYMREFMRRKRAAQSQ